MSTRRKFSREFKVEAVKLVLERGVTVTQAAKDLDVHVNVLRTWVREHRADPSHAFPGECQQKPEAAEMTRLRAGSDAVEDGARPSKKSRGGFKGSVQSSMTAQLVTDALTMAI